MTYLKNLGIFIFLAAAIVLAACNDSSDKPADVTADQPPDSVVVTLIGQDSTSVLDLLLANHEVEYKESSMGAFVTGIDSINGGGAAFWIYSVNDTMVPLAADKMIVRDGDTIRWHLRKSGS